MRKKRGYDRETPDELLRDYKLFAIACEGGKREPDYFNIFRFISGRIAVDVVEEIVSDEEMEALVEHKSAPKWVLDRAIRYIEKEGLSEEDDLWFVLDKDRWSDEQLREIFEYCQQKQNWNIVISNPCFEVWLFFHKRIDINSSTSVSCNDFKYEISTFQKGGYHPLRYIATLDQAIVNARNADNNPGYFMPEPKQTKVYQLAQSILGFVGVNEYNNFITGKLPALIKIELSKMNVAKKKSGTRR